MLFLRILELIRTVFSFNERLVFILLIKLTFSKSLQCLFVTPLRLNLLRAPSIEQRFAANTDLDLAEYTF